MATGRDLEQHADDGTTVLVVSDHGMGPAEGAVNMTRVLAEAGLLRVRPEAGRDDSIPLRLRAVRGVRRFFRDGAGRVLKPLALRLMPERAKAAVARTELSSIDWERTLAFPWGTARASGRRDAWVPVMPMRWLATWHRPSRSCGTRRRRSS